MQGSTQLNTATSASSINHARVAAPLSPREHECVETPHERRRDPPTEAAFRPRRQRCSPGRRDRARPNERAACDGRMTVEGMSQSRSRRGLVRGARVLSGGPARPAVLMAPRGDSSFLIPQLMQAGSRMLMSFACHAARIKALSGDLLAQLPLPRVRTRSVGRARRGMSRPRSDRGVACGAAVGT